MKPSLPAAGLLLGLLATSVLFAYEAGGFAFTKKVETSLLAEPSPLAAAAGKLAYGKKVKIDQVQGAWLHVSEGQNSGWVFAGNVSDTKPAEVKGLFDNTTVLASKTSATAASRGIEDEAKQYAVGRQLGSAQEDLEWMLTAAAAVTEEDVVQYLKDHKRGEFQ